MSPNRGYRLVEAPLVDANTMSRKISEHSFSVELNSRAHLRELAVSDSDGRTLVEGVLGAIHEMVYRDGVLLEVHAEHGTLRLDILREEMDTLIDSVVKQQRSE